MIRFHSWPPEGNQSLFGPQLKVKPQASSLQIITIIFFVYFKFSFSYLFDSLQHALAALPWLGVLPDAAQAGHTVPLPVLQLPVEGVGQ